MFLMNEGRYGVAPMMKEGVKKKEKRKYKTERKDVMG